MIDKSMQKTRKPPRNIRFQDSVDVKEIPPKDVESQLIPTPNHHREPVRNPILPCRNAFKTQQNVIIGIVLVCVIVGTVGRIVLSQEKATVADHSRTYDEVCENGSNQCDTKKNLLCNNTRCRCDSFTKYWNIKLQTCQLRLNYSQACRVNDDCLPTLICPNISGICNCSRYLPSFVCNCNNTKYYNPTLAQCVNRASIDGSCLTSANYTCLLSLYCKAGTCICPKGMKWMAAKTTCIASRYS